MRIDELFGTDRDIGCSSASPLTFSPRHEGMSPSHDPNDLTSIQIVSIPRWTAPGPPNGGRPRSRRRAAICARQLRAAIDGGLVVTWATVASWAASFRIPESALRDAWRDLYGDQDPETYSRTRTLEPRMRDMRQRRIEMLRTRPRRVGYHVRDVPVDPFAGGE